MDWNHIEQLIDKYYDGETSLQEEQELKQAFQRDDVPIHLEYEQELFKSIAVEVEETMSKPIQFPSESKKGNTRNAWLPLVGAIAACLLIVFGSNLLVSKPVCKTEQALVIINGEPICDSELAKAKTLETLKLVSHKMNSPIEPLK